MMIKIIITITLLFFSYIMIVLAKVMWYSIHGQLIKMLLGFGLILL